MRRMSSSPRLINNRNRQLENNIIVSDVKIISCYDPIFLGSHIIIIILTGIMSPLLIIPSDTRFL